MYCISISHKRAPAHIREQYAFTKEERAEFVRKLIEETKVSGAVMLCTCNRSELYFSSTKAEEEREAVIERVEEQFAAYKQVAKEEFLRYLNVFEGDLATTHLFKVCGGFESKILGEDEILRQVKEAYEEAKENGTTGYELNMTFQKAIASAKRIKTHTEISNMPISIATLVANEVAQLEKEGEKRVLLMGLTGKIGGDVAKNLLCKPNIKILGTVRNVTSKQGDEKDGIQIVPYANRYEYINDADVIISATSSPHYTLCADKTAEVMKTKKERLFLDLAMPRDIDAEMVQLPGVTLHNIDYFDTISKRNGTLKLEELDRATMILEEEKQELIKELVFHEYREQIPRWKEIFEQMPLEKILYRMKKKADEESLKTVLEVFGKLEEWMVKE